MFHIITNLELLFDSLEEAQDYARQRPESHPSVPSSAMPEEDRTTPRICGAPTLPDCVSALKPAGIFRRCLNSSPDAKSYENEDEVYPVLIAEFGDRLDWIKPTPKQVPDVKQTKERWLLEPARPLRMDVRWLGSRSLKIRDDEKSGLILCTGVAFASPVSKHHPWLDGKGHPLDNSDMGSEPWPPRDEIRKDLWFDFHFGGQLCYRRPLVPFDGRCQMYPLDPAVKPYKSFPDRMRRFSGWKDKKGNLVLDQQLVRYHEQVGYVRFLDGIAWTFIPMNADPMFPIRPEDIGEDLRIESLVVLNPEWIKIPETI